MLTVNGFPATLSLGSSLAGDLRDLDYHELRRLEQRHRHNDVNDTVWGKPNAPMTTGGFAPFYALGCKPTT
jgi:hypothetical protein